MNAAEILYWVFTSISFVIVFLAFTETEEPLDDDLLVSHALRIRSRNSSLDIAADPVLSIGDDHESV